MTGAVQAQLGTLSAQTVYITVGNRFGLNQGFGWVASDPTGAAVPSSLHGAGLFMALMDTNVGDFVFGLSPDTIPATYFRKIELETSPGVFVPLQRLGADYTDISVGFDRYWGWATPTIWNLSMVGQVKRLIINW